MGINLSSLESLPEERQVEVLTQMRKNYLIHMEVLEKVNIISQFGGFNQLIFAKQSSPGSVKRSHLSADNARLGALLYALHHSSGENKSGHHKKSKKGSHSLQLAIQFAQLSLF